MKSECTYQLNCELTEDELAQLRWGAERLQGLGGMPASEVLLMALDSAKKVRTIKKPARKVQP